MMSFSLMAGASQKLKKFEQQRRPWIAISVTILVLFVLVYAGTLGSEELKQEASQQVQNIAEKSISGGHTHEESADSGYVSDEATKAVLAKSDEASLLTRLSECTINHDVPDPARSRKYTEDPTVSETGAWELPEKYDFYFDEELAQGLVCLFESEWVLELGAGTGHYTQYLMKSEKVKGIRAYDGAVDIVQRSAGIVRHADLTTKREFGGPFDWVLALDVAAHIPKEYEEIFLDNIHRHAKKGVVISWAKPGTSGVGLVNTREEEYVMDLFKKMGYMHYPKLQLQLRKTAKLWWLRHTIMVFVLKSHECTNC